ncbi:MAG: SIS domain-containing protein [Candidatus Woesearchaeota archaeon]
MDENNVREPSKDSMNGTADEYFELVLRARPDFRELNNAIEQAAQIIASCFKNGGKVLICGNGGSAADAQHIAGELVVRYFRERKAYPAITLSADSSVMTACSNDYGYEHVFKRQVEALGKKGDVLIGISTSGSSPNVVHAVEYAKQNSIYTIGLLGKKGCKLAGMVDTAICIESGITPIIQIWHSIAYHSLCHRIEILMEQS